MNSTGVPTVSANCIDWFAPPPGAFKLNNDVAVRKGAAIRDDKGRVFVANSKPLAGVFNAEIGEFLAHREGLLLAKNHNLNVQIAEVDASYVASVLNSMDLF
ncbi:hypothetical protein Dsin_025791 [Dipteronia sinensis]|uniref:RNase H type-1 domain-containing protein n=1 Tax=Dipteronia sinensis TaxID=43782 RepID=A0AAD9ZX12_9ROSI|nr:hypothetical protein Dsin_025791 [Dipteronia sinensis]